MPLRHCFERSGDLGCWPRLDRLAESSARVLEIIQDHDALSLSWLRMCEPALRSGHINQSSDVCIETGFGAVGIANDSAQFFVEATFQA